MRRWCVLAAVVFSLAAVCVVVGGPPVRPPYSPYPGGSPFPPGKEPSLTHVAKVFWTTRDGLTTRVDVVAPGKRPTQLHCVAVEKDKTRTVLQSIAPDCNHHYRIAAARPTTPIRNVQDLTAKGEGTFTVRVHGWQLEDFGNPPVVTVVYLRGDQVVGQTSVQAQPIPAKLMPKPAPSSG
jgi:hypothetical protein